MKGLNCSNRLTKLRVLSELVSKYAFGWKVFVFPVRLRAATAIGVLPQLGSKILRDKLGFCNPILLAELSFWLGILQIALYYAQENSLSIKNQIVIIWLVSVLIYIEIRKGQKSGSD